MRNRLALRWVFFGMTVLSLGTASMAIAQDASSNLEMRIWTSTAGSKIEGRLVGFSRGKASIAVIGKGTIKVEPAQLSSADQVYLAPWSAKNGTNWTSVEKIEPAFSGTVAGNTTKPGDMAVVIPKEDRPLIVGSAGGLETPFVFRTLTPTDREEKYRLVIYITARDSDTKVQSLKDVEISSGYYEASIDSVTNNSTTRFGPGKDFILLFVFVVNEKDECISPILHLKGSVE